MSSLYSINANYDIDPTTLLLIYKTQIRPIWEYGCMFYIQTQNKIDRLQIIQNRFLRFIFQPLREPRWNCFIE